MSEKAPKTERIEKPGHVDADLAWDIAHAQKQHTEDFLRATKAGNFKEAAGHWALAETEGQTAAQEAVYKKEDEIDKQRRELESQLIKMRAQGNPEFFENKVAKVQCALAERYADMGVKEADFSLVDNIHGTTSKAIVYRGAIDLGSEHREYDSIMNDDSGHIVEIDGQSYDDRAFTKNVYKALMESFDSDINSMSDNSFSRRMNIPLVPYTDYDGESYETHPSVLETGGRDCRDYDEVYALDMNPTMSNGESVSFPKSDEFSSRLLFCPTVFIDK